MKLVFPQFLQFEHVFTGFTLTAQFRSAMAYFQIKSNVCWTFWDESQLLNLFTSKFWHLLPIVGGCSRVLIRGQKAKNWDFEAILSQTTGKILIFTKFPVFSYFFYFFDSKTLKNSNLVDGEQGGLLLGLGGSVSKIFRGVAIRL